MHGRNHYDTLGVPRNATADQVRRAYRALARALHPDVNPDADAQNRFAQAQAAYAVLSDPERRRVYDRSLNSSERADQPRSPAQAHYTWTNIADPGSRPPEPGKARTEFDDLYDAFFVDHTPPDDDPRAD